MFDKFRDYMYYLLHAKDNQVYILFSVLGSIFDQIKEDIFEIRNQANILTATGRHLDMHGKDRDMPRLKNEEDEAYRRRLLMKTEIAARAGTLEGLKLALQVMGYEPKVDLMYLEDPEKWAEFIIYLDSTEKSFLELDILNDEVMKTKQASAKPNYGITTNDGVEITPELKTDYIEYPICNVLTCGTYPDSEAIGKSLDVTVGYDLAIDCLENNKYRCNTFNADER